MYPFTYFRPTTIDEAVRLMKGAADGRVLAGGMSLLPSLKLRLAAPSELIDLSALEELREVRFEPDHIRLGAMVKHVTVADDPEIRRRLPALADLAAGIGDPQVRNRGTIGGSISNNDPAADYPAAVLGLGATVETSKREIPADEFFKGLFETALDDDELVTGVRFPIPAAARYLKFRHPASRFALAGVMVARLGTGVRVAVTGAGPCVFRVTAFEQALSERFDVASLSGLDISSEGLTSDIQADAEYRAHIVGTLARRAVTEIQV